MVHSGIKAKKNIGRAEIYLQVAGYYHSIRTNTRTFVSGNNNNNFLKEYDYG